MIKIRNILRLYIILFFCVSVLNAQNTFFQNKGQMPKQVKAKVNLPSGSLFIEDGKLVYAFYSGEQLASVHALKQSEKYISAHAYHAQFVNCNRDITTELIGESRYYENYFLGDQSKWATRVKSYKTLCQKNVYAGIDVRYYVNKDKLKYDIIIGPNASSNKIKIKYKGLKEIRLREENLYAVTTVNTIIEKQPYAYQLINGKKIDVACIYKLNKNELSFSFPEGYNANYTLIIDPVLDFSTYSGSTTDNFGYTATYDNFGFLYSGSTSFGVGYPTTLGAYQINYANASGGTDIAITKYDTSGTQRIYSTYLGGQNDELPHSMIVNSANELFVYGTTASADFPTTSSAFQQNFKGGGSFSPAGIGVSFPNGSDIFVSRLSASGGALLSSTFIGGTGNDGLNTASSLKYNYADEVRGEIDIDKQNNIYIASCTKSTDFPTKNSFQNNSNGGQEGCVIKMDNQLTTIIWSTYLGGGRDDAIYSLAIDKNDDIYVTGGTNSSDFPTSTNAYQNIYQDSIKADAFVAKISTNGSQIINSSYFGTDKYDQSYFVEIGSQNNVYLFGQTETTGTNLVTNATYSVADGGQFIAVFNNDLSGVLSSTVLGTGKGTPDISPTAFLVDVCDKIYIAGWGSVVGVGGPLSTLNLPVTQTAYQNQTDGNDFYLMVLDDELSTVIYATYYGGSQSNEHVDGGTSRFDKKGIIYQSVCAGCGGNSDFPIEPNPGAVSSTNNSSNCNNGVFKFNFDFPMVVADFSAPWVDCDTSVSFNNLSSSSSSASYIWNFGDGNTSNDVHPTHSYSQNGIYNVTLIAIDNNACNVVDTITKQIYILSNSLDTLNIVIKCFNQQAQVGLLPVNDPNVTYTWSPPTSLSSVNVSNPFCDINTNLQYQLLVSNGGCTDTLIQNVLVTDLSLDAGLDTSFCNTPVLLNANFSSNVTFVHWSTNRWFTDTISTSGDLIISNPGIFYVKVFDVNCSQVDSVEVLSSNINIDVFANDVCLGDSVLVGVTNLNLSVPIISYNWNVNDFDTAAFIDIPTFEKWYAVEVINSEGCIIKDSVFINVYEYPVVDSIWATDTIIFNGEETTLSVITSDNLIWDDFLSSKPSQSASPNKTKCYNFQVLNEYNCVIKDSICIEVMDAFCDSKNIKIPNAFSPNEDNVNDFYFVQDLDEIVTVFNLEIFNRLGQKVFSTSDILNRWDGTFRGKKLSPQVFDYYLKLECIGGKRLFHKGNITLIR